MPTMRCVIPTLVLLASLAARADVEADFAAWDSTVPVSLAAVREMVKFRTGAGALETAYARALSAKVHRLVRERTRARVHELLAGNCSARISAEFQSPGFADGGDAAGLTDLQKDFEEDLLRIEATACFSGGTPERAMEIFLDPEYRRRAMPQVKEFRLEGDRILIETHAVPLLVAPTRSWMKTWGFAAPTVNALLGQIDANAPEFQAIYLREANTVFVQLPDGKLAAYLLSYVRGESLSNIWHGFASGKVAEAQRRAFDVLGRDLAR